MWARRPGWQRGQAWRQATTQGRGNTVRAHLPGPSGAAAHVGAVAWVTPQPATCVDRTLHHGLRAHRGILQEKLPVYLRFFEFVHNVRKRGKALLPALIELLVT